MDEYLRVWGIDYYASLMEIETVSVGGICGVVGGVRNTWTFCRVDRVHGGERNEILGLFARMVGVGEYQWFCVPGECGGVWARGSSVYVLAFADDNAVVGEDDKAGISDACDYIIYDSDGGWYYEFDFEKFGARDGARFV